MENNKKLTILIGAQSWAYGPAGKAAAIGHELKKHGVIVDFVGADTSFEFCKNTKYFKDILRIKSPKDYLKIDFSKYDAVISVMDSFLAFLAKKNNLPIFYADSMSLFWIWKNNKEVIEKFEILKNIDLKSGMEMMSKMDPDDRQLLGHLFSDKIFTQGTSQFILETKNKVKNVGSMIDLSFADNKKRDTILVSLSGGISHATDLNSAIKYAEMIIDLISDDIKNISLGKRFVLTGHPSVIKEIKKRMGNKNKIFKFFALNHKQFLEEINRAVVVFAPCGFTTIFESLALNAPIIFLPDNHNGHVYEYLIISERIEKNRENIFPNLLFTLDCSNLKDIRKIDDSMKMIKYFTEEFFKYGNFYKKYKQKFKEIVNSFNVDNNLADKQKKAIKDFIPHFNGAELVANNVIASVKKYEKNN